MSFAHLISWFMRVFGGYCSQIVPNFAKPRTIDVTNAGFIFGESGAPQRDKFGILALGGLNVYGIHFFLTASTLNASGLNAVRGAGHLTA